MQGTETRCHAFLMDEYDGDPMTQLQSAALRNAREEIAALRELAKTAYATPEWAQKHRTAETDALVFPGVKIA